MFDCEGVVGDTTGCIETAWRQTVAWSTTLQISSLWHGLSLSLCLSVSLSLKDWC